MEVDPSAMEAPVKLQLQITVEVAMEAGLMIQSHSDFQFACKGWHKLESYKKKLFFKNFPIFFNVFKTQFFLRGANVYTIRDK